MKNDNTSAAIHANEQSYVAGEQNQQKTGEKISGVGADRESRNNPCRSASIGHEERRS